MKSNKYMIIGFVTIVVLLIANPFLKMSSKDTVTATVTKTEHVCKNDADMGRSCKYMIFTDKEVFENIDYLWFGKFNSSDIHAKLKEGKTYQFRVIGWRIPVISKYRNVLGVSDEK